MKYYITLRIDLEVEADSEDEAVDAAKDQMMGREFTSDQLEATWIEAVKE